MTVELVAEAAVSDIDVHWIVEQMIGHDPTTLFPYEARDTGAAALEVTDLTRRARTGRCLLDRVSFRWRPARSSGSTG